MAACSGVILRAWVRPMRMSDSAWQRRSIEVENEPCTLIAMLAFDGR